MVPADHSSSSAPLDRYAVQHAVGELDRTARNIERTVRIMLGGYWFLFCVLGANFISVVMIYRVSLRTQPLANTYPFSPNLIWLYIVFLLQFALLWWIVRQLNTWTVTVTRAELADQLNRAGLAADLVDRRLDFTTILTHEFTAARLLNLSRRRKAAPTLAYRLTLLAENLYTHLGIQPRHVLLNRDYSLIALVVYLAAAWMLLDYFAEANLWMIYVFVILLGAVLCILPVEFRRLIAFEELSRHLRRHLGV